MDSSWLSETSSEIANYLYEHIAPSGDGQTAGTQALSSLRALSKGFWITDLPTNDYEPLENSPVAFLYDVQFFVLYHALQIIVKDVRAQKLPTHRFF